MSNGGGYSQIECELNLMKTALKDCKHSYYHLLSGHDMLLKPARVVYDYFENSGKNHVGFNLDRLKESNYSRYSYYHFNIHFRLKRILLKVQRLFGVDRIKKSGWVYMKGANWFSIREDAAKYVVSQEKKIKKQFIHTTAGDELFLQTVLYNSDFRPSLSTDYDDISYRVVDESGCCMSCMRAIHWPDEWETPHPKTFVMNDYELLKKNKAMFARKFATNVDEEVINRIYHDTVIE